jgi:hypothetical protein
MGYRGMRGRGIGYRDLAALLQVQAGSDEDKEQEKAAAIVAAAPLVTSPGQHAWLADGSPGCCSSYCFKLLDRGLGHMLRKSEAAARAGY